MGPFRRSFALGGPLFDYVNGSVGFTQEATEQLVARGYRLLGGFDVLWLKSAIAQSRSWLTAR
jgi:hypothetical protein